MLKHTTRHQLTEMCFCSVMMWSVNQICNTFIIFKSAVQRVLSYNGIDQEEDRVIKKPRRPEFLRANDVDWGKAPTSQSEAKGCWCTCSYVGSPRYWSHIRQAMRKCRRRGGFFQRKIPVSGEIKKSRDSLRPWSCGKTLPVIFGYKEYAQYFEPWVSSFFFFHGCCLCLISCFVCQQMKPWSLLVTFLISEIFWTNQEKWSRFMRV